MLILRPRTHDLILSRYATCIDLCINRMSVLHTFNFSSLPLLKYFNMICHHKMALK